MQLKNVSRRDFLKIGGAAAVSITLAELGVLNYENNNILSESIKDPSILTSMQNIKRARESIGLTGITNSMVQEFSKEVDWESSDPPVFVNGLDTINTSYSMRVQEFAHILFGKNYTRIVGATAQTESNNGTFLFNQKTRSIELEFNLHETKPNDDILNHKLAHEIGHATDTTLDSSWCDSKKYWPLLEQYWGALSQIFSIENKFFNDDKTTRLVIATRVGQQIAFELRTKGDFFDVVRFDESYLIDEIVKNIATDRNVDVQKVRFNKKTCKAIGVEIGR